MRSYHERLFAPVSWWFLGTVIVAILGAELWAGFGALVALVTYAVLLLVCGGTLAHWGSASVRVTDDELEAGGRRLPRHAIGDVVPLGARQADAARGRHADPAAHARTKGTPRNATNTPNTTSWADHGRGQTWADTMRPLLSSACHSPASSLI